MESAATDGMRDAVGGGRNGAESAAVAGYGRGFLFATCFIALVTTSFAFIIRVMVMDAWQIDFALTETQKGQIFGAGMWPFGVTIVLFSLVIDKFGYGKSLAFAFFCHIASTVLLVCATGYWGLYLGSVFNGLAAGTVEAVINPAVASMYPRNKTKMLTILHAGWPGGFVLGGLLIMAMGGAGWMYKVSIILLPTLVYGIMLIKCKFPISERVLAKVSYRDMLREPGAIGCLLVSYLIIMEFNRLLGMNNLHLGFLELPSWPMLVLMVLITVIYFLYTMSLGNPMYLFLLFIMILLAITELGTDTWIKELMKPAMTKLGLDAGLVLVYTATIMMVLRFCVTPFEKALKPLGVLLMSSLFAAAGLYFLAHAQGVMILAMATIYGIGQCFFWPVTLGLVAERFPKGGALTLNAIAGVGMLGVGIFGAQLLGYWQDTSIDRDLKAHPDVHGRFMDQETKKSIFGPYHALDNKKINALNARINLRDYRAQAAADIPADQLEAKLAEDPKYQTLVRTAFDHILREKGDKEIRPHPTMVEELAAAGAFIDENTYQLEYANQGVVDEVIAAAKRNAMASVAILPLIMAACYLGLIIYFHMQGGYKAVELTAAPREERDPTSEPG